jgi:hypothetical protein
MALKPPCLKTAFIMPVFAVGANHKDSKPKSLPHRKNDRAANNYLFLIEIGTGLSYNPALGGLSDRQNKRRVLQP